MTPIRRLLISGLATILLLPSVVYLASALAAGFGVVEALRACVEQFAVRRQNLALATLLGVFPWLLLLALLWQPGKMGARPARRSAMAAGGLTAMSLVLLWAHSEVWPLFLPGKPFPGWPHGIELVLGPGFYAPIAMFLGAGIAAALSGFRE